LDELKRKLSGKLLETEALLEAAQAKASSLDKVNNRLRGELEDLTVEVERVRNNSFLNILSYFNMKAICIMMHKKNIKMHHLAISM